MTDSIKIFHNPKCTKSRLTMELLTNKGVKPQVIEYLKTPPSKKELNDILNCLQLEPRQLMRSHETEYKENNLADVNLSREQLIDAMIQFPKIMQRPIVINNGKAAIGRPPENILEVL
ncbi:Uncharacterized protein YfgD, not an arsenate reductase [hydrothermal vent metagenome]|uniref:Uncharacterized protein YfgD, not an arsenate reductase n=1 Tax=hydrothermal vent metagenome TaxID=652676 RepID=A0A3B0X995_9ZZZZ